MYYCVKCNQLHGTVDASTIVFSTGFYFVNDHKINVGVCKEMQHCVNAFALPFQ
jgi:hypothetical protein